MFAEARFTNCQITSDIFINKDEKGRTSMSFFIKFYNLYKKKDCPVAFTNHSAPILTFNLQIINQYKDILKKGTRLNLMTDIHSEDGEDGIKRTTYKIQNTIGAIHICGDDRYDVLKMIQEDE